MCSVSCLGHLLTAAAAAEEGLALPGKDQYGVQILHSSLSNPDGQPMDFWSLPITLSDTICVFVFFPISGHVRRSHWQSRLLHSLWAMIVPVGPPDPFVLTPVNVGIMAPLWRKDVCSLMVLFCFVLFFILRTSNLLDQTGIAQGSVPRSKIGLALTSKCTLSRSRPWVQMDINSSGSVFCCPDAGGSWPEAWGCRSEALSLAWGAEPPTLKPRGGSWLPTLHLRLPSRAGGQHLSGVCLLGTAASDTGESCHPPADSELRGFMLLFFLLIWIFCNFTCKPLATKWFVIYSKLLATPSNQGRHHKKKKSAKFVGSLVASATWPQLGRRWLTPLSPCLDARDEQGSWETPNTVWSRVSLK